MESWSNNGSIFRPVTNVGPNVTFYCFPVLSKTPGCGLFWRQEDTQDEHLWFEMGFTRMSQSAVLEWIEMLRWSNIDRPLLAVVLFEYHLVARQASGFFFFTSHASSAARRT